jgi:P-type E1-E2 ATPase
VRRDAVEQDVAQSAVVLADILVLRAGDQVPADARIVRSRGLQIDESMLTGESDAVDKHPGDEALSGSIVVGGRVMRRSSAWAPTPTRMRSPTRRSASLSWARSCATRSTAC